MQMGMLAFTDGCGTYQHQGGAQHLSELFFHLFISPKMKNELEKVHGSNPQDTVDAANGDAPSRGMFEGFERFESSKGYQSERGRRQASTRGGFEKFESSRGCQSKQESPSEPLKPLEPLEPLKPLEPLELDKLEERFRKECRKSCRRNFWIELLKTAGKIAGVILAAFGLSSFNEEN